jgi:hypothetical protein
MDGHKRNKNAERPPYPQSVDEWQEAIGEALNLTAEEGKARYQDNTFPFDDLAVWIRREFSADKGYSPGFIPALIRNRKGLIAWVYGDGSEPYWPGQDENK